jgi:hypothetical protein
MLERCIEAVNPACFQLVTELDRGGRANDSCPRRESYASAVANDTNPGRRGAPPGAVMPEKASVDPIRVSGPRREVVGRARPSVFGECPKVEREAGDALHVDFARGGWAKTRARLLQLPVRRDRSSRDAATLDERRARPRVSAVTSAKIGMTSS